MRNLSAPKLLLLSMLTGILMLAGAPLQAMPVATLSSGDRALLDMRQAFQAGNSQRLTQLLPRAAGHPLEPLAAYWEINVRLRDAAPAEVHSFLRRWQGSFYEDRLRHDWLLELGQARNWTLFLQELPLLRMNPEREVSCYALVADSSRPYAQRAAALPDLWLRQRQEEEGCARAAEHFLAGGHLPREVVWQRARLAMERNQLAIATQAVALLEPDWVDLVQAIHGNPQRYLDEKLSALRPHTQELVTLALIRLAARDPQAAAEQASRLRWQAQLSAENLSWVSGVIGRRLAQRLSPEAMTHFAKAQNRHLSEEHLAWKARAALRAGAWNEVHDAIVAMREAQRNEPVWSYWLARALMEQGSRASRGQAQEHLQRIAGTTGFYEQLALEALGRTVITPPAPAPLTLAEVADARSHPGLQRALHAIQMGLRTEGVREWHHAIALNTAGGMSDRELLAAADFACSREVWDRCINTSKRTRSEADHSQRFVMPFRATIVQSARASGIDPALVFGLISQESRFVMDARSHVGAAGLMQLMPATAAATARRIGLRGFQSDHVTQLETNVTLGTAYLKMALDHFDGSEILALAAYNAGRGRPNNWRNGPVLEAAIWIENIPFDETRGYVQRVLANATNYAALITGQPQTLTSRLGVVGPSAATAQAPAADPALARAQVWSQ